MGLESKNGVSRTLLVDGEKDKQGQEIDCQTEVGWGLQRRALLGQTAYRLLQDEQARTQPLKSQRHW